MKALYLLGFALLLLAALLFVAGAPTINALPREKANFYGIGAAIAGVFAWVASGVFRRADETADG